MKVWELREALLDGINNRSWSFDDEVFCLVGAYTPEIGKVTNVRPENTFEDRQGVMIEGD